MYVCVWVFKILIYTFFLPFFNVIYNNFIPIFDYRLLLL